MSVAEKCRWVGLKNSARNTCFNESKANSYCRKRVKKGETMLKYFVTFLGACSLAHCQEMYLESGKMNEENGTSHVHIHLSETINSTDQYIARDESAYFASALFKKYNTSDNLSLDGFVRLLCRIGLIPDLADDGKPEADATFPMEDQRSPNCGELTFDKVPLTFEDLQIDESGLDHEDLDHNDVPNSMKANPSSAHDEADHVHDHKDHDHTHEVHDDEHDHHHHDAHHHDDQSSQNGHEAGHGHDSADKGKMKRRAIPENSSSDSNLQGQLPKVHVHPTHLKKCISPKELLDFFHIPRSKLNIEQFTLLCPALLYKLDSGNCQHLHAHGPHRHVHDHHGHHSHGEEEEEVELVALSVVSPKVWGYSTAAVLVISLAGLLGVAVIPIMQKVFYNHLLQFLVAIAVGALSGDALLHLLPHAIAKNHAHKDDPHHAHAHGAQETQEDNHLEAVWKGLIALTCIFFFFLVERVLTIVTEKKRRKKTMSRLKKKRCERLCDAEKGSKVGAKLSAHADGDYADCEQMVMVVHPNREGADDPALKGYADATHDVVMHQCDESLSQAEHNLDEDNNAGAAVGHAHGHGHSHLSSVPGSVAAVAWMVIFGDGIHNFSDGLAIGAAFASGVTGGISTSIAVFCHELPHEIGDFAVLLRAGMSVKQAIVYNCVSSVLCFIGMLVGVAIGNIQNASLWIFAGVGGMFIYISMVDMLPEMTAVDTKKGENHFLHLLLQVGGMMIGSGIMLMIAVFEHDLQMLLD